MVMDTKVPRKTKPAVRRSKQPRTRFDDFDEFDDDENINLRELGLE